MSGQQLLKEKEAGLPELEIVLAGEAAADVGVVEHAHNVSALGRNAAGVIGALLVAAQRLLVLEGFAGHGQSAGFAMLREISSSSVVSVLSAGFIYCSPLRWLSCLNQVVLKGNPLEYFSLAQDRQLVGAVREALK